MADVNISKYRASVVRDGSKPASPGFVVSEGQDPVNPPGTNNYVPYTGATANVELGEFGIEAGFVTLDTTPTNIPTDQGAIYWDDTRSTAALIMNGTLQHIGQDSFFYVKNSSGSTIPKGTCVGFAGTDGGSGHILIEPFLANGTYPSSYFMGVTSETIANGAFGQVMHFGELKGINTSGYTAGALLYASTTVAGGFQTTPPVAPNNIVLIAAAINSTNNGAIIVRPQIGSNINNDEGVKITSPTTGDLLQLQAGGLWENKTLAQVIGSAYVPSTRTLTINGTAFDLSANRYWTVGDVRTDGSYSNPSWITALAWSKITGTPTTLSGYGITDAVPNSRTITINGVTQDLSANRSFNVGTVTSVGLSSATSGVTIGSTPVTSSGTITLAIATATATQQGLLSSADWSTFNNKQNALTLTTTGTSGAATLVGATLNIPQYQAAGTYVTSVTASSPLASSGGTTPNITIQQASGSQSGFLSSTDWTTFNNKQNALTNPVTGTGTTNYLPKFTGSTTVGNSQVFDNGNGVSINYTSFPAATYRFQVRQGTNRIFGIAEQDSELSIEAYNDAVNAGVPLRIYSTKTQLLNGNLLVGTTSDNGARLQVSGAATINQASGSPILRVAGGGDGSGGGKGNIRSSDQGGTNFWDFGRDNLTTGNFVLTSNGGSPILSVATSGAATFSSSVTANGAGSATSGTINLISSDSFIRFNTTGGTADKQKWDIRAISATGFEALEFRTVNDANNSFSTKMWLAHNGNVGIGTTTFAYSPRLAVASVGQNSIAIQTTDTVQGSAGTILYLGTGSSTGSSTYGQIVPLGNGGTSAANLVLQPTGSNGNVLIGTTTDNGNRLRVNGNSWFDGEVAVNAITCTSGNTNTFINPIGTSGIIYSGQGTTAVHQFLVNSGERFAVTNTGIRTNAPTGGSVGIWKLGTAVNGTVNANRLIRIEIDGIGYDLVARQII